ncbi:MAG: hypothetical protein JWN46_1551 [Acidimicrobiales bacterium]|nr:hypothetical protein [Acidimicrobiales bacterium]
MSTSTADGLDGHITAERTRLSEALGYAICGHHGGATRFDGAPALCLMERHHQGDHVIPIG